MPACRRTLYWFVLVAAAILSQNSLNASVPRTISYRVAVQDPMSKLFSVNGKIQGNTSGQLQIDWAAWTPGYVILWDYGQHVQSLTAKRPDGQELRVRRVSQSRWFIDTKGNSELSFSYSVKAVDPESNMGFAQAYLDSNQGWYNGAAMFPLIDGFESTPCTIDFDMPRTWRVATGMEKNPSGKGFRVKDYRELADSPVEIGTFLEKEFETFGTRIKIVVSGSDSVNMDDVSNLVRKIAEGTFSLMGSSPIDRFLFIFHAAPNGAGGLEHLNATTISVRREEFFSKESWLKIVVAHEFFHVWNAKRIHPRTFNRYDLSRPHRTHTVWFSEGITAYYTDLILCRTGLSTREEVYKSLASIIDLYENNPAHERLSWEDISWYIWEPEIRQGLQVWLLPGWMIDLKIRDVSNNRASLDDVMRFMDSSYGESGDGFGEHEIGKIASSIAGHDLGGFFRNHISDANSFPYMELLAVAGLEWTVEKRQVSTLGCQVWWSGGGRNHVAWIDETAAPGEVPLTIGDTVLEINGTSCSSEKEFDRVMEATKPGEKLSVKIRRSGEELVLPVVMRQRERIRSSIVEMPNPTPRQLLIRQGILEGAKSE
ncbi:MAG TPA: hypothetical protein VGA55_00310 [Bacteroidota bacterium]